MPLSGRRLAAPIKIFSQKNLPFNVQGLDRLKIWKYKIAPTTLQRNIFKMIISHCLAIDHYQANPIVPWHLFRRICVKGYFVSERLQKYSVWYLTAVEWDFQNWGENCEFIRTWLRRRPPASPAGGESVTLRIFPPLLPDAPAVWCPSDTKTNTKYKNTNTQNEKYKYCQDISDI